MLRAIIALLALATTQAHAGAWPREKGTAFLSFSIEADVESSHQTYVTIYGEYGVTEKLTLGIDLGGDDVVRDKAFVFLRYPGKSKLGNTISAWDLGIGQTENQLAFRLGTAIGRGIKWRKIDGWLGLETRTIFFSNGLLGNFEMDATLGLSVTPQSKLIFQVQGVIPPLAQSYAKIAPSYVFEFRPGHHLEIGASAGVIGTDDFKLKIGTWHHF